MIVATQGEHMFVLSDKSSLPVARAPGRIILLHGASSSGKSTLARAIQVQLDEPFLHLSSDQMVGMLPERRDADGPFAWWTGLRPPFFHGFHRCIPAFALTGNDLVVEHIIELAAWRDELAELLRGLDVFLVGVHCDLDTLDRRERERGDRRIGEGRAHVEVDGIHTFGPYDHEIDTTDRAPEAAAADVIAAWRRRSRPGVLSG
jgi:chloramphenicol 3-O phosphotransferase